MKLYNYTFELMILFLALKILNHLLKGVIISMRSNTENNKSNKGIISIKDLQLKDYDRFIDCVRYYLYCNFYDNIEFLKQTDVYITEATATLNTEETYIFCIQNEMLDSDNNDEDNWTATDISTLKIYVSKLISQGASKGLVINNSIYTEDAIEYIYKINQTTNNINITLIDGYDFTRLLRTYRENSEEEGELTDAE